MMESAISSIHNERNTHHPSSDALCKYINLNKLIAQTRLALLVNYKKQETGTFNLTALG